MLPALRRLSNDYPINLIYKKNTWGVWYPFPPPPNTIILRNGESDPALHRAILSTRKAVDDLLNKLGQGDTIIFSTHLSTYFSDKFASAIFSYSDDTGTPIPRTQALKNWSDGIGLLADRASRKGIHIILISPLPQFMMMLPNGINCRQQWFNIDNLCKTGVARRDLDRGNATIYASLDQLKANHANVLVVDPMDTFCSKSSCYSNRNQDIYFLDADHMSAPGALHFYQKG